MFLCRFQRKWELIFYEYPVLAAHCPHPTSKIQKKTKLELIFD